VFRSFEPQFREWNSPSAEGLSIFYAYLDSVALSRADFEKAIVYVSRQFGFDSPATPSPGRYATLAFGYCNVVGFYVTDPTLGDPGEVAVRLVLLAEAEMIRPVR
jgi:hypothetical protein